MYKKKLDKNFWTSMAMATVGAGIVTSFAVSQGQHPLIALALTIISASCAVICDRLGII